MDINKFQRSRLTFQLRSLNFNWSPINILKHSFLATIDTIELKFLLKTPYDKLAKNIQNDFVA